MALIGKHIAVCLFFPKMMVAAVWQKSLTADIRQPWTNYVNNGNEYLIIGAVVCSAYSNI